MLRERQRQKPAMSIINKLVHAGRGCAASVSSSIFSQTPRWCATRTAVEMQEQQHLIDRNTSRLYGAGRERQGMVSLPFLLT